MCVGLTIASSEADAPGYQKHNLCFGRYEASSDDTAKPPSKALWHAHMMPSSNQRKGHVGLSLAERKPSGGGFMPVISYLAPKEALALADALKRSAEEVMELAEILRERTKAIDEHDR